MYGFRVRELFGADRPDSEAEHLSAIRGLLLSWLKGEPAMSTKYLRIQGVLAEVTRCLRDLGYSNDPRDLNDPDGDFEPIPNAEQELFLRYLNVISHMWSVLSELRKL